MDSRLRLVVLVIAIAILGLPAPGSALEKAVARVTADHDGWRSAGTSSTCLIDYYNLCNGWIWVWSGWAPNDQVGVSFTNCCASGLAAEAADSFVFFLTGAPSGYGFTGTIDLWNADASHCPTGPSLASQPLLPLSNWNGVVFGNVAVAQNFAVTFTFSAAIGNPAELATDHPDSGPTGPVACGTCYPTTRENRSFYYGTPASPLCPGSPFNDGICDAQFLWDATVHCVTSVEPTSWASIKGLYR